MIKAFRKASSDRPNRWEPLCPSENITINHLERDGITEIILPFRNNNGVTLIMLLIRDERPWVSVDEER